MPDTLEINLRNADSKLSNLVSGQTNEMTVRSRSSVTVIEMEDINFHFDSAVLLPDYGTDEPQPGTQEQNRITGLAVLYACYKQAEKMEYAQSILAAGHTDKKGTENYNLTLSQKRAENVLYMFTAKRPQWVNSSNDQYQVEDVQQILKWISFNFRYDCDPGDITNSLNSETTSAILNFQKRYNYDFVIKKVHANNFTRVFTLISEDGKMGPETWGAFFDMYILELLIIMGINEDGLNEIISKLNFVTKGHACPAPAVGCGENFPASGASSEDENSVDRRVEILFFDEGEEPLLECHSSRFHCTKSKCDLYPRDVFYTHEPVPVAPLPLPSGTAVRVHLMFQYLTPDKNKRPLPKGFPFMLMYQDGTSEEKKIESENGQVFLQVLREKKSFTLEFNFSDTAFISSPADSSLKDEITDKAGAMEKIRNGFRVFSLPLKFRLKNSAWEITHTNFDDTTKEFKDLDNLSVENIGSEGSPVKMLLDPKWLHLKFTYFDRFKKQRLTIPPLTLEGFNDAGSAGGSADTVSRWADASGEFQAIPWILQEGSKPDDKVLVQFRTVPQTFIDSSGSNIKLVSKSGFTVSEPGMNAGDPVNNDFIQPNVGRMKYYDLPEIWKSRTYYTKQASETSGADPAKDFFEKLVVNKTTHSRPLLFSLDDIVLFIGDNHGGIFAPFDWDGKEIAVLCNTFNNKDAAGNSSPPNLTNFGLYKPATNADYTSEKEVAAVRSDKLAHIVDYPDWVRIVAAKGNLFEAFDLRTPDGNTGVVGARAAVRWIDSTSLLAPGNDTSSRPGITRTKNTFIIQPFFYQVHDYHGRIGRYDMVFLRCCDIDSDKEKSVSLHYFRFHFSFNFTLTQSDQNNHRVASTLSGPQAQTFMNDTCNAIMHRWNGDDSTNGYRAKFTPKDSGSALPEGQAVWFIQALPDADKNLAHFELRVFNDNAGRPFMTRLGKGELNETYLTANPHETGHGDSLVDEYVERWTSASYRQPGFYSYSPGAPFDFDSTAMMNGNQTIRTRYYWHIAEWLNKLYNAEFIFERNSIKFGLPTHPHKTEKTYVSFPISSAANQEAGDRGKFDLFLYNLGEDEFNRDILRNHPVKGKTSLPPFDAILIIIVKMRFEFHTNTHNDIKSGLGRINSGIFSQFNQKFYASSTQKNIQRCLLHFFPRYLVKNYSGDAELNGDMGVSNEAGYTSAMNSIADTYKLHFDVETKASGSSEWDETWLERLVGDKNDLRIKLDATIGVRFPRFFANMVGISDGTADDPHSYEPVARKLMPDAQISKVFP